MKSLREKLLLIEDRIIGWPDNVATWTTEPDSDVAFGVLETELKDALDQISIMPQEERNEYKDIIANFHTKIQMHYEETERNLREMQNTVDTNFKYVKAVKAYTMQ